MTDTITPADFIAKWRGNPLTERQASHTHFIDLCRLLGEPAPYDADTDADAYCFEKGATKTTGADGWADVWKKGSFGWEYKGPRKDLTTAYAQLQQYAVALENPPLLVVCDRERFRIHTNFTNSVSKIYEIELAELADPDKRQLLKAVFSDPESLRPGKTRQSLTVEVAEKFASLALSLRARGHDAKATAHFINRIVFCMFAEDVKLLPNDMFKRMLEHALRQPDEFKDLAADLFRAMQAGGRVGFERVDWFNGGLFDDDATLPLKRDDIALILEVARQDWSDIDPSILGTLFERGLDPDKRSQLGAHYTDRDKIMQIVQPVIVEPLLAEWEVKKAAIAVQMELHEKARARRPERQADARRVFAAARREEERAYREAQRLHAEYIERLRKVRVLDPACGSGNFLYLALLALKDLEHKANLDVEALGLGRFTPSVGPECLKGIEINPYAAELARVTVWIGEIQWMRRNGYDASRNPILRPLDTIECRDAIINDGAEASWPPCEFIIGNPPFLGAKLMNRRLGKPETEALRAAFAGRLKGFSDLVCYWFEKARAEIVSGNTRRVGLVGTSSIRGGTNRPVLDRIARDATIFEAWSEQPWTVEGARVEVSLVCFCARTDAPATFRLDGRAVQQINSDLTTGIDLTRAVALEQNKGASLLGIQTSGPHDVDGAVARAWMALPLNPNGRGNHEILKPYWNGDDVTGRPRDRWLIDFPLNLTEAEASRYEAPFEYLKTARYDPASASDMRTLPEARAAARDDYARQRWWEPYWPRPEMRKRIQAMPRYIATTETSQHRLFIWLSYPTLPDKNLIVIVRDDDTTFGILHSRFHELWSLRLGTSLEDRPRYTSTTTFATFPFPDGLTPDIQAAKFAKNAAAQRIAAAARKLDELRNAWLNPPDLIRREPEKIGLFPHRVMPVSPAAEDTLRSRTLTDLYNQKHSWLLAAHRELDEAVAAAYGISPAISDEDALSHLLTLNMQRAARQAQEKKSKAGP